MSEPRLHRLVHEATVSAPAGVVYGLVADTTRWPLFMPSVIHVEQLEFDGTCEYLRMYAFAQGTVSSWASTRVLDPEQRVVTFRQVVPAAPLTVMEGRWTAVALTPETTLLRLEHAFAVSVGGTEAADWVEAVTKENSRRDLDRFRALAERWTRLDDAVLHFSDSVRLRGSAELAYDVLHRAADWAEELAGWAGTVVTEQEPGVQRLTVPDLDSDRGQVRICFPHAGRIVFKGTEPHSSIESHIGEWSVEPDEDGVTLTVSHSVVLTEEAAASPEARREVRESIGAQNTALLQLAKHHAETGVPVLWAR